MFDLIYLIFLGCQRRLSHWGDSVWFLGHNSTPKFHFLLCPLGGCLGSSCLHPTIPGSQTTCCCCWYSSMSNQGTNSWHPPRISSCLRICTVVPYKRPNLPHLQTGTLSVFYDDSVKPVHPSPVSWGGTTWMLTSSTEVSHVWIKQAIQKSCVLPTALQSRAVSIISHVTNANFASFKENLT
jgi:hypothetical protein